MTWSSQSVKLSEQKEKFNCWHMSTVGADGKSREMLCMPVEKLPFYQQVENAIELVTLPGRGDVFPAAH
ncbi:phage antirepressor N-terminal domain-containing protein [Beijerinckia mobilis]|uniref:phage antirepressor N-terminal domain-containing protein n=1 Tax=Beijerinckia mobilis TaxID=231434 RepID=UPI003522605B